MRNSSTILALALVSVFNLQSAPASGAQVFEASQAKGGQLMQTDKGKPAVFFPTTAPAGDKIVWTPDTPLPPGLWQVDVEFHHTGNPTSVNEMLVFEGADSANLGKLDFYYSWIQKGTSTKSYGFYNSQPLQSLALLKSSQRNLDTVAVTSIRITPGNPSALERQQFVFSVPVNGPSVSLPHPLPPGLYVAKTGKPVALDWALPDGRRFATPAAAETRVFLDQAAQPSVTSGGPIQEILLNHYPIPSGPDMSSAGTEPLLTVFDPAKIESRTLKLIGYHGTELPKPDLLPGGKSVAVVTSWDDGREQDAILTDLLVKYGFKGTLVMNRGSKILGRLRELEAKGMEIGSHSWSHPAFYLSSPKRCLDEAVEMRRFLEKEYGHPVISFAYPYNYQPAYDADGDFVLRAVREAGYLSARATSSGDNHIEAIPDPLQMRPNFHFNAGAARVKAKFEELLKTPGSILYIWGHSYELTPAGIKTLEEGLAAVANRPEAWYATLGQLMVWKYMREHLQIEPAADSADGRSLTLKMPWIHPFWRQVPLSLTVPTGVTAVNWNGQQVPVVDGHVQLTW